SGSERIHVFSVDEGLRTTLRQILEVLGYDVRLSAEPSEALREVRASDPELLLVDLAAAEAPAQRRLLREALDAKPQLKIIVVTDGVDARTRFPDRAQVMAKPFSLADLAGTLRKVLK